MFQTQMTKFVTERNIFFLILIEERIFSETVKRNVSLDTSCEIVHWKMAVIFLTL